ncbi:multidrug effflux MFS transporter [Rhodobacteraceae bacterium DSL-40]|uniref:multidrug effflux MFS transporter n=1 Tax=Amaricoccus sp. B4 TaxID=3368557 RepID=UPI000DADB994
MQAPSPEKAEPVWLDRRSPPALLTLVLVTGLAALNMNVILPSLPKLATHFGADYALVQLTVSGYLAATAVLQLLIGPLSDRFGRRPIILISLAIFLAATLGCLFAPSFGAFLFFRLLQASVASAIALSRAVVRDMVPSEQAASMIGYVTMGMAVAPMIGPMIGGLLDEWFGWQSVFWMTLGCGVAVFALAWADLGETNLAPSTDFAAQFRALPELARSRRFWGYSATAAFASGAFFAFLGGGPWVAMHVLGMTSAELGLYFGLIALGYMIGNYGAARITVQVGMNRMMLLGSLIAVLSIALAALAFAAGLGHPLGFFGAMFFLGFGNGLALPSANAGMVSVRPHLAGSASGLGGAMMIGGGAALSAIAGALLGPGTGPWPLLIIMGLSVCGSVLSSLDVIRTARRRGDNPLGSVTRTS